MVCGVINIDIVKSRKVKDRAELQNKLNMYINILNQKFFSILVAPITITLGDEWQIVISEPSESYNMVQEFQQLFWEDGIELYAGIGIGNLLTEVDEDVRNMDGPCFTSARKAIDIAKKGKIRSKKYIHSKKNRVYFYSQEMHLENNRDIGFKEILDQVAAAKDIDNYDINNAIDLLEYKLINSKFSIMPDYYSKLGQLINTLIENNEVLKSKMTTKQKMLFIDYRKYGSYRNIIDAYADTSQYTSTGNISMMLHNAEYFVIQHNLKVIQDLFVWYCKIWGAAF